jgi:signal transduction histidine kinase
MSRDALTVLLVTADAGLAERLAAELAGGRDTPLVTVAATLDRARRRLGMDVPAVIFLDETLTGEGSREMLTREMARHAPLVVAVSPAHQADLASLISMGEVDCVTTTGNFLPMILALLDRRLRWVKYSVQFEEALAADEAVDFGSLLRHELNNPLTGILGNAEMLLRHPEKLARDASLRVETIADLAVRLRETIRRISNAWEARQRLGTGDLG